MKRSSSADVGLAVIGAGAIGLSIGWRAAVAGPRVLVLERGEPVSGASHHAPGIVGATVASVLELLDVPPDALGIAVAVNGEVVARSRWDATALRGGSMVEVVAAIGGG